MAPSRSEGLRRLVVAALFCGAAAAIGSAPAHAAEPENLQRARTEFVAATDHVKNARWGEALAAFERSFELRPHALTTFNIGACERALGRYSKARATLVRALTANEQSTPRELAPSFVTDAKKWVDEIDGILVHASITITPPDATILIDGAPLVPSTTPGEYMPSPVPSEHPASVGDKLTVLLDPGVHVFRLSKTGFANAVVTKNLAPGTKPDIALDLQSLPATIRIASNRAGSVIAIDGLDVGIAPVTVTRPAGVYQLKVRKIGCVPYETTVTVARGDSPSIEATLPEEKTPVTKTWWFWTAAAAIVVGAATATYFATRPEPQRPAPDGGGLGWVVSLPGAAK